MKLKKGQIMRNCFYKVKEEERINSAFSYILSFVQENNLKPLDSEDEKIVQDLIFKLKYRYNEFYSSARSWENLERHRIKFLEKDFEFDFLPKLDIPISTNENQTVENGLAQRGRKKKSFASKKRTAKWKTVKKLTTDDEFDSTALLEAAMVAANKEKNFSRAAGIKKLLGKKKKHLENKSGLKVAAKPDVFEFFITNNLSKQQFKNIKIFTDSHNAKILPSYDTLRNLKQSCYPTGIIVTALEAFVPVQNLFEHIVRRLIDCFSEEFSQKIEGDHADLIIELSYGFDGSSGYGHYNMAIEQGRSDDNLIAVACVPLRIKNSEGRIFWENPSPASPRLCLPIRLLFAKENKILSKKIYADLKEEISKLTPLENLALSANGKCVTVNAVFYLALVDNKVISDITDTGYASCAICKSTPKQFKSLDIWSEDRPIPENAKIGITPLHVRMRLFEHVYNIGQKLVVEEWRSGNNPLVKANKLVIQKDFWEKMNLRVDMPNQSGGNSNTGNTSRRAFENCVLFGECVGFNDEQTILIFMFKNVITVISCPLQFDSQKFKQYCYDIHKSYNEIFPWAVMSATLHKVIRHGFQLMNFFTMPLAMLTEEASESKNKFYRRDRLEHARKSSRAANLEDIFHRSFERSDPFFSSKILSKLKSKSKSMPLPLEVINMLKDPNNPNNHYSIEDFATNEDDVLFENEEDT